MASLDVINTITLSVTRPNSGVVVYAKQFDKMSRIVNMHLVHGDRVWDPPEGEVVVMYAKPDGKKGIYDVADSAALYSDEATYHVGDQCRHGDSIYECNTTIDTPESWNSSHWNYLKDATPAVSKISTGYYQLVLAEQALNVAGNVAVEVSFYSDEKRSTTFSFIVSVEPGVPDDDTLKSNDYFNVLSGLIEGLLGAAVYPPQIDPVTRNWKLWNSELGVYEVSEYSSVGTQGDQGPRGYSIATLRWVSGNHDAGTNDTYSVDLENGTSAGTFDVWNGANAQGSADPGNVNPYPDGVASYGSDNAYSRRDHVHPANVDNTDPEDIGFEAYSGESNVYARRDHVHAIGQEIIDMLYPIGSIYMSTKPTSPSQLFGGDWIQIQNEFLIGAGDEYEVQSHGGEKEHKLLIEELPSHTHTTGGRSVYAIGSNNPALISNSSTAASGHPATSSTGGNEPHNNIPPYYAVYIGERILLEEYDDTGTEIYEGHFYEDQGTIYYCIESSGEVLSGPLYDFVGEYVNEVTRW